MARASATEASIHVCLGDTNSTIDSADGGGAFCVCANVLVGKIELLRRIAIVAVCLVVLQAMLFVMALVLMGLDPAKSITTVGAVVRSKKVMV